MKQKIILSLLFLTILSSSLYFGLPRLKDFSGVDEPYWSYDRVPKFWQSIKNKKWKSTNICDKPGITLAIISGAGLPFISQDIKELGSLRYKPKTLEQVASIRDIYHKLRFPVFIFTLLSLPIFYILIKKILGENTANFSLLFMGLSPILLGISLIINSDSILWITTSLSTLCLFAFFKTTEKKYLLFSGFLLGLSVITKYVANILFIYFFLLFFLEYIFHTHQKANIGKYLKQALSNYLLLFATALVTAFAFFPAAWVKFSNLWKATLGNEVFSSTWPLFVGAILLFGLDVLLLKNKISLFIFSPLAKYRNIVLRSGCLVLFAFSAIVFLHAFSSLNFYDIQRFISSPKGIGIDFDSIDASIKTISSAEKIGNFSYIINQYIGSVTADFYSLFFSISPLVLLSVLLAGFFVLQAKNIERDLSLAVYIIFFLLIFYFGSAVNNVTTTVRYQIMTYPLIFILAAIGINRALIICKRKFFLCSTCLLFFSAVLLFFSLTKISPHFLAYTSEILPKNKIVNFKGMGEGSFEAGNYLNSLPNAHKMTIWSDKGAVCEVFVGRCHINLKNDTFKETRLDYFVVSTDRRSRSLKLSNGNIGGIDFQKLYFSEKPDFEIIIGGREVNFVRVIKNNFSQEK